MGKFSRDKGKRFERAVADDLRRVFPNRSVRRSTQADAAFEPDVVVDGAPLWIECQHATRTTPSKKLAQAERDLTLSRERSPERWLGAYCIAVTKQGRERAVLATMRLDTLLRLLYIAERGTSSSDPAERARSGNLEITLAWDDVLTLLTDRGL